LRKWVAGGRMNWPSPGGVERPAPNRGQGRETRAQHCGWSEVVRGGLKRIVSPIISPAVKKASRLGRVLRDLLLPPRCAYCDAEMPGAGGPLLCVDCCDRMVPGAVVRCGRCRSIRLRFDCVVPLGSYADELRGAVLEMKHRRGDRLSVEIGGLYCRHRGVKVRAFQPDLLVPVPMFWARRMLRGTNSAEILAETIGRRLGIAVESRLVARTRNTKPQKDLGPTERFRNVRGAFRLRTGYGLEGARVVVVDDILTTGATCSEVAGLLKRRGAGQVAVAIVARANAVE